MLFDKQHEEGEDGAEKELTNLIRGMQMINKRYMVAVKSGQQEPGSNTLKESKLSKALFRRTILIHPRQSIYSESLNMILALRQVIYGTFAI